MKDLRFDNQRGSSVACDLVDVVRCRDCEFWTGKPGNAIGGCRTWSSNLEQPEAITKQDGYCYFAERNDEPCEPKKK